MEVTLHSTQGYPIVLSYQALAALIHALPDSPDYQSFYSEQAAHPSLLVREAIASKQHLSESAIHRLLSDPSGGVLEALVYNPTAQALLSADSLTTLLKDSVTAAKAIAYTLDRWNDRKALLDGLLHHLDPSVREALAESGSVPKPLLAKLAQDIDPAVKEAATRSLVG